MRKLFASVLLALGLLASESNAAWGLRYQSSTDSWIPDALNCGSGLCTNEATAYNNSTTAGAHSNLTAIVSSFIQPADTTNSWVQYSINVTGSTTMRDVIIFRNPLSARMAPIIKSFQEQLNAGKRIYLIRDLTSSAKATGGWDGFGGNSYEINPGDKVMFSFR